MGPRPRSGFCRFWNVESLMRFSLNRKPEAAEEQPRPQIPVVYADPARGLSESEVTERFAAGYDNRDIAPPTKTVKEIILSNVFTYFNIVFFVLAACLILVGSWYNLTFMGVVFSNMFIGIVQELKSKRTLDKMSLITSPKGVAIRDGKKLTLRTDELVRDDIVVFSAGSQIYADAAVVAGECQVNEALITGEADEIRKAPGDQLLSGSFVVSGSCRARLTQVGADSYVSRLTIEAKKQHGSDEFYPYSISGNNVDGFIVTVQLREPSQPAVPDNTVEAAGGDSQTAQDNS